MDYTSITKAHEDYRRAIEIGRDENLPEETRTKALTDAVEMRRVIDEAVAELVKSKEEDDARAKTEAVIHADPVVALANEKRAFNQTIIDIADGKRQNMTLTADAPEMRTDYPMTTTEASTVYSSYNVKTELWNAIEWHENAESAVKRAGPKVLRTAGDHTIYIPVLGTDAVADTTPGSENTAPTHAMYPVFTREQLDSYRVQGFMTVSEEMLRTPDYPFFDVLTEVAARALAVQEATYLARGTGSSQPDGLYYVGTSAATCGSASTFTYPELVKLYFGPTEGVRNRGQWFLSTYAMIELFSMVNGEGSPIIQPSPVAGASDTLFGKPLHEEAYLVASTITTGEKHVFFGDISKLWVRYAGGIDIGASREMRFNEWEVVIRAALWMDCCMPDSTGMYYLTQG